MDNASTHPGGGRVVCEVIIVVVGREGILKNPRELKFLLTRGDDCLDMKDFGK